MNEVWGNSRGDSLAWEVRALCKKAGIEGLEFLQALDATPSHWRLPLGIEGGPEEVYGHACGYWLEGDALERSRDAVSALLIWCRCHTDAIDMNSMVDLVDAIDDGDRLEHADVRSACGLDEAEGAEYVFGYLGTLRHLLGNAISAKLPVLHVAEILD